jgi:hypothetical protein
MVPIIEEVTAALLAFCSTIAGRIANPSPAGRALAQPGSNRRQTAPVGDRSAR